MPQGPSSAAAVFGRCPQTAGTAHLAGQHSRAAQSDGAVGLFVAGETIEAEDLAFILSPAGHSPAFVDPDLPLSEATDKFQIEYIKKAIERARTNMSLAAERLGLHRSNLYRKMRQLGMSAGEE